MDRLKFVSLFTGIGGFDLGFEMAGMECLLQVECDKHCNKVLETHWPNVRRMSDVRDVKGSDCAGADIICGGFPCQDLSVAGKRKGITGERSGLFFELARIVDETRPEYVVWENVPGLLSSESGRDFETVIGTLADLGYSGAWRVLDSQYFGVAQQRDRLFACFAKGDTGWRRAGAVLLECEGSGWCPSEVRGEKSASANDVANCITSREWQRLEPTSETFIAERAGTLSGASGRSGGYMPNAENAADGYLVGERQVGALQARDFKGVGNQYVSEGKLVCEKADAAGVREAASVSRRLDDPKCFTQNTREEVRFIGGDGSVAGALGAEPGTHQQNYVAAMQFTERGRNNGPQLEWNTEIAYALTNPGSGGRSNARMVACPIRYDKSPEELLPKGMDTPRYKCCGNAVTVNVIYWIGLRLAQVHEYWLQTN